MSVRILDPTVAAAPVSARAVSTLASLDGKVLGLLANGKLNADGLLELVRAGLAERYRLADVVVRAKTNASRPAPPELLDELAGRCDAVVTAIGD